jgi:hypothetical protein
VWRKAACDRFAQIEDISRRRGNGSSRPRLCENSPTFSHGPISFAFSSPETVQRRRNHGNLRSARPVAKFRGVLTRPRPEGDLQSRRDERAETARKRTSARGVGCARSGPSLLTSWEHVNWPETRAPGSSNKGGRFALLDPAWFASVSSLEVREAQARGVADDADGRQRHRSRRDDR